MHNRWWSVSGTCGGADTSLLRRRRCRTMLCHFEAHISGSTLSAGCALWACPRLSMVKHLRRKTRITHSSWVCNRAAVEVFLGAFRSPHSRLRRQCGVMQVVTARAVNINGYQFITPIRHLTHNRVSGYIVNNLMLTASEAEPATWGKPMKPIAINRGAVADSAVEDNSRFS